MPTTITSAGITFNDATSITTAIVGTTQIANEAVTAAKLGTTEQKRIAKAWVNFNGATIANDYTTGNTVTYTAGASTTTVTVTRSSHAVSVGDSITVSGVTGVAGVNGTFQVTAVTATTFQYIVNSVVTGTVAGTAVVRVATIRGTPYNVSSITKNGTGDYTINFATPMADANYTVVGSNEQQVTGALNWIGFNVADSTTPRTNGSARVLCWYGGTATNKTNLDSSVISIQVFGN